MKKPEIKEHTPIQPRPLTPTVRTPQCGHTVWGTRHVSGMWVTMSLMCEMCFTCHSFFLSSRPMRVLPQWPETWQDLLRTKYASHSYDSYDSYVVTRRSGDAFVPNRRFTQESFSPVRQLTSTPESFSIGTCAWMHFTHFLRLKPLRPRTLLWFHSPAMENQKLTTSVGGGNEWQWCQYQRSFQGHPKHAATFPNSLKANKFMASGLKTVCKEKSTGIGRRSRAACKRTKLECNE